MVYNKQNFDEKYITSDEILDNVTNPDKPIRYLVYIATFLFFANLIFNILYVYDKYLKNKLFPK